MKQDFDHESEEVDVECVLVTSLYEVLCAQTTDSPILLYLVSQPNLFLIEKLFPKNITSN